MKKISRKKTITAIPYVFTFLNVFFGFLSVIKTLDHEFVMAAYFILLAAAMDFIDGRLARAFGSASYFGMELDSLCDAISFCFAPAILLHSWYLHNFDGVALLALVFYLCSGLFRLAKFNVLHEKQRDYFVGLPTTIAAFFLANLVLYQQWIVASPLRFLLRPDGVVLMLVVISFLMLSPARFPSFKRYRLKFKTRFFAAIAAFIVASWCIVYGYPVTLLVPLLYMVGGVLVSLYFLVQKVVAA